VEIKNVALVLQEHVFNFQRGKAYLNKEISGMIMLSSHLHQLISQTTNIIPQISKELASQHKKFLGLQGMLLTIKLGPSPQN